MIDSYIDTIYPGLCYLNYRLARTPCNEFRMQVFQYQFWFCKSGIFLRLV